MNRAAQRVQMQARSTRMFSLIFHLLFSFFQKVFTISLFFSFAKADDEDVLIGAKDEPKIGNGDIFNPCDLVQVMPICERKDIYIYIYKQKKKKKKKKKKR